MKIATVAMTIAALIVTPVCAQRSSRTDGFKFKAAEYYRQSPAITIITHQSETELLAAMPADTKQLMRAENRTLHAWSKINGNRCEVHVVDPRVNYMPEYIGHEITHCLYGQFHD